MSFSLNGRCFGSSSFRQCFARLRQGLRGLGVCHLRFRHNPPNHGGLQSGNVLGQLGVLEQSEIPFGDETLGARMRGFDRDFLRALAVPARAGKIVLGEIERGDAPIVPAAGQRIAVGHQRNIRAMNVYSDAETNTTRNAVIALQRSL